MERKQFIKNLIGTTIAVSLAPYVESLLPVPAAAVADVPGISGTVFKLNFIRGTFVPHQIIRMGSYPNDIYLRRDEKEKLIGIDITTGNQVVEIEETEKYNFGLLDLNEPDNLKAMSYHSNGQSVTALCSAVPEMSSVVARSQIPRTTIEWADDHSRKVAVYQHLYEHKSST